MLHGYGDPSVLSGECISIVGARKATPYGRTCAKMAGRAAAECGITVVSGGAIGCDQCAGTAALDAGGRTVVIPGCGADCVYPSSSDKLFARAVRGGGCVVSLEHWGAPPARYTFVRRNKAIAALSTVLVVCEAARPSGTFHTATTAAELGRRVYAVPGSIFSANSRGTNWLIESGASIVTDEESLEGLISLDYGRLRTQVESHDLPRGALLDALVASPMRADEIFCPSRPGSSPDACRPCGAGGARACVPTSRLSICAHRASSAGAQCIGIDSQALTGDSWANSRR